MKLYELVAIILTGLFICPIFLQAGTIEGKVPGKDCTEMIVYLNVKAEGLKAPPEPAVLDQKGKEFVPHVQAVMVGQTVIFKNSDAFFHNVHAYRGKDTLFNLAMPFAGMTEQVVMNEPGEIVILCDAHPEMSAYILVLDTPFFTTPDAHGQYRIENVPPGKYTLVMYQPEHKQIEKTVQVLGEEKVAMNF